MSILKVKPKTHTKGPDKTKAIQKAIEDAHGSYVSIGWQDDKRYPDGGPLVGQVALWNELGTYGPDHEAHTPARPFMRPAIEDNRGIIDATREHAIRNTITCQWTARRGLEEIGTVVAGLIKEKIKSNVPPPLADSTRRRKISKGRDPVTLIDTGLMLQSLSFVVHMTDKLKARDSEILKSQNERARVQKEREKKRAQLRDEGKKIRETAKAKRAATKAQRREIMKRLKAGKKVGKKRRAAVKKAVERAAKKFQKAVGKGVKKAKGNATKALKKAAKAISGKSKGRPRKKPPESKGDA